MKKLLLCLLVASFPLFAVQEVSPEVKAELRLLGNTPRFMVRVLDGTESFAGDRHEQFAGDDVAVLNDGSRWKVHPEDKAKFRKWNLGDLVYTDLRTEPYFFKREHKFKLYNQNLKQFVRVMLVEYPKYPLIVQSYQDIEVDRQLITREKKDQYGQTVKDSQGKPVMEQYWAIIYHRDLLLSDGTLWRIAKDLDSFYEGKYVYLGLNLNTDSFAYFLISGTQREAVWTNAKKRW